MSDDRTVRITNVSFQHYKAFEKFGLTLERTNILTGANNAGKSTVIGAFRALAVAIRSARSRKPERIQVGGSRLIAYRISPKVLPISSENVQTNYGAGESTVTFRLSNGSRLELYFDSEEGCVLVPHVKDKVITTAATFKSNFPLDLVVVPVLGAVEHREELVEEETVNAWIATHRASRHFRSYWYRNAESFQAFAEIVARTWPGMRLKAPELDVMSRQLSMFVAEDRIDRELYWVGFGFQIWCQLLTHLMRSAPDSLVVVDEPEIYLHPDLQRKLLWVLRDFGCDVLMATHSTEILAEAHPDEIVLIDKARSSADRLRDIEGVQRAISVLGSQQNLTLTALARNRRVLFVEGDQDFSLIRRFAKRLGFDELAAGLGLAAMPSGGFASWKRITILADGIGEALGTKLLIGAVYDRDYHCDEEVKDVLEALGKSLVLAHVHERKEIENYLLVPAALDRAIIKAAKQRPDWDRIAPDIVGFDSRHALEAIADELREDIEAQFVDKYSQYVRRCRKEKTDGSGLTRVAIKRFRTRWETLEGRLQVVSGKEVLRRLRELVAERFRVSLSDARILEGMRRDEIASDLQDLLRRLDEFSRQVV